MTTTNYSWTLPTVGASVNTWGTLVNNILTDIDAKMFARTGGAISDNVSVAGKVSATGRYKVTSASDAMVQLTNTTASTGKDWMVNSHSDGKLYFGVNGVANYAELSPTGLAVTGVLSATGVVNIDGQINNSATGTFEIINRNGTSIDFYTNSASVFAGRFDAIGNLLVGTTSGTEHTLQKSAPSSYSATISNLSASNGYVLQLKSASAAGATWNLIDGFANGAAVFKTAGNGNVSNLNNSYGAISSKFYKTNIVDTSPKLPKILKIRVVNYNLIDDPEKLKQLGVIWEELNEISPGLCEETPDYEEVTLIREVEKTVPVTVKKEVTTELVRLEVIDGVAVQKVIRETSVIDEPVVDEYPVFDGDGNPVMEVVTPATEAEIDEKGNEVKAAMPAVLRQKIHTVPRMETVVDKEEYTERRLTGTTTKSVKYSIFVPMLIKAMQEQQEQIEALKAKVGA